MKRRFILIVLLLALGAIVNVVVAWAFMLRHETVFRATHTSTKGESGDWIAHYRASDVEIYNTTHSAAAGITLESVNSVQPWRTSTSAMLTASRCTVGWPMKSLAGGYWNVFGYKQGDSMAHVSDTIAVDSFIVGDTSVGAFIPLRPIWLGFAINTLFYAAIVWLLVFAPFTLRRTLRIRRGLCPACAYPRGESNLCTECGKPLPKCVA